MINFLQQLWSRNVVQFGVLYIGAAWLILQAASLLENTLELPEWFDQAVFAALLLGFPLALILAWAQNSSASASPARRGADRKKDKTKRTLAILPFNNFSSDPEQEHFADSLSEDLITEFSKLDDLNVVARNSSFAYKGKAVDVREAGAKLHADLVLEGSLRKTDRAIRYTAQLIDCETGHHLWAKRDDLTITDLLETQDEITSSIIKDVRIILANPEKASIAPAPDTSTGRSAPGKVYTFEEFVVPGPYETRYAESDGLQIAYNVRGEGPPNIVYAPGIISHLYITENFPSFANTAHALAKFSHLLCFDKRGQGMSDPTNAAPTLEERIDDIRAVMDDAGMDKAFLYGLSEGGPMSILFAATYPERVQGLILVGTTARWTYADDYQIGIQPEDIMVVADHWGDGKLRRIFMPTLSESVLPDHVYRAVEQVTASRRNVRHNMEMLTELDVRDILPSIRVPTLVIHFSGDLAVPVRMGRYLAEHIPGAEFMEIVGADHADITADSRSIERIQAFCAKVLAQETTAHGNGAEEILATVVEVSHSATIPDELLDQVRADFEATAIQRAGPDRATLAFDGPSRAVRAALEINEQLGRRARISAHTGLIERNPGKVSGPAAEKVLELNQLIEPGRVAVTGTLSDLLVRSGLMLEPFRTAPPGFGRLAEVKPA